MTDKWQISGFNELKAVFLNDEKCEFTLEIKLKSHFISIVPIQYVTNKFV